MSIVNRLINFNKNNNYDAILSVRLKSDDKDEFLRYCKRINKSGSDVLREYIEEINNKEDRK